MTPELDSMRSRFGRLLVLLLWAHVPLIAGVAWLNGQSPLLAGLAPAALAACYHASYQLRGIAPVTRYISAIALMGEPALLVFVMRGHPWQMDMHMYFFAMLALMIAWFDRRPILLAAVAVALHHLILLYLIPFAVFPSEGTLSRVLLHAAIVAFQTAVLVWLADMLSNAFRRIREMNKALVESNASLAQRSEEAEKANSAKSMFLANMSHEIRTPLNAVLGFCHLLQRTQMTPRQVDYITKISSSGSALLRLINDILDLSKHDAGKLTLETTPFNPHAVIEHQLQMVLEQAREKGLKLDVQKDPTLPSRIVGDELRFGQVILNLVNNAVKFTEHGSVTVRTRMQSRDETSVVLAVEVIDTGIGMTEEQVDRLFTAFTQADSSMTRRYGGTGLGLAISQQIVGLMGGEISVRSQPWQGTIFSFTVKLGLTSAGPQLKTAPHPALRPLRFLSVDDNPASRQLVQDIFAQWSMQADTTASGAEALTLLEAASSEGRPYDCVLIDWKMPDMDGLETVRAISASKYLSKLPRMVLVTAYGSEVLTGEIEAAGVCGYLPKPLEPQALIATLDELFAPESEAPPPAPGENPSAEGSLSIPMVAPAFRGARVLLVEDIEINREIAGQLLEDAGLQVDMAENGLEAVNEVKARGSDFQLVLMDLQMPVMDGLEATQIIRETYDAKRLPILAMTAHAYADERQRCLDIGMNDHIAKPVKPEVLVATLDRWLRPVNTITAVPPIAAAAAAPAAVLPDQLPPFGIAEALQRVNGNRALLRRLIISFAETQADISSEIHMMLERGSLDEARRAAHTLKGLAGSLELPDLQALAAELEQRLRLGETRGLDPLLDQLQSALAPAVEAGRSLSAGAALVLPGPVLPQSSSSDTRALSDRLHSQLVKRNLGARSSYLELAAALGMDAVAASAHPLYKALERLDYASALDELETLRSASSLASEI
ncbi:response regulator [Pseudogemmobacter faecipullorum]|uniref:histidine kinase n=1 Tax=Pseudogemmobacter faecipullorum TaxID=2755041 RepID=A0ABS8CPY2_9RHOB|nr:response regulator [Pseudogemmobacter faecipullorum]MCB5411255.1 response regulator [Pseudogemmobacter faecipullorum]